MSKPPPEKETYKQTDFVEAAMPKGKRKGKWTTATTLLKDKIAKEVHNARKRRLNNRTGKNGKPERQGRVIHDVEKVAPNQHGKYIYYDWNEEEAEIACKSYKVAAHETTNMNDYTIINTEVGSNKRNLGTKSALVFDKNNGEFIVGKISERQSSECMGRAYDLHALYHNIKKTLRLKPDIGRGNQRSGLSSAYKISGWRKNPKGTNVSRYAFLRNAEAKDKEDALKTTEDLCDKMETASSRIGNSLQESDTFKVVKKFTRLPSVVEGKLATAINIGENYWSKCHVDNDFYYTTLSCLAPTGKDTRDIIYYFCNPEYKIAIPMRSGDILLFNPHQTHSVCNPRYKDCLIFSAYVSKKTVLTQTSDVFLNH